jgi:hypothetical protein
MHTENLRKSIQYVQSNFNQNFNAYTKKMFIRCEMSTTQMKPF